MGGKWFYYRSWAAHQGGLGKFEVESIGPNLCTHITYAFIGLSENNTVLVLDPTNDLDENGGRGKILISIGGWSEGSAKYSEIAKDPVKRQTFLNSVVQFIQSQNFDGLDLDWEYPGNREGSSPEDKQNFVLLINEHREEFDKYHYLLTAAVGADTRLVDSSLQMPIIFC